MLILAFCSVLPCLITGGIACWNALCAPRLHRFANKNYFPQSKPLVSLLIPARNEELNIRPCLDSLVASSYPHFEIIVGDDQSSDRTPEILASYQKVWGERLQTFRSQQAPPQGWTGKAWMCHQLAQRAKGEILVFCDADVQIQHNHQGSPVAPTDGEDHGKLHGAFHANDALFQTVHALESEKADALSALPLQVGASAFCRALVALISQTSILVALPISLVPKSHPSLAAGNGQWFAWRKSAYLKMGGHAAVKSSCLEDVTMARLAKLQGLRLLLVAAPRSLTVTMYRNLKEAKEGFRKNLFLLVGGSSVGAGIGALLVGAWTLSIVKSILTFPSLVFFFGGWFLLLSWAQKKVFATPLEVRCLIPFSWPLATEVLAKSWWGHLRGNLVWKDRSLVSNLQQNRAKRQK